MPSFPIVVAFDVTETLRLGCFDIFKDSAHYQFRLEPGKETFRLSVVIAVAFAAH
jgi:hypothetical protein